MHHLQKPAPAERFPLGRLSSDVFFPRFSRKKQSGWKWEFEKGVKKNFRDGPLWMCKTWKSWIGKSVILRCGTKIPERFQSWLSVSSTSSLRANCKLANGSCHVPPRALTCHGRTTQQSAIDNELGVFLPAQVTRFPWSGWMESCFFIEHSTCVGWCEQAT